MKLITKYEDINFPSWALCALLNGDITGLNDDEIKMIDSFSAEWMESAKIDGGTHFGQDTTGESYFSSNPEFGLDCDCYSMTVYIWGN